MSAPFAILSENAQAIRLAELGALLHNVGKLLPEFERVMRGTRADRRTFDYAMIAGRTPVWDPDGGGKNQSERSVSVWRAATSDDGSLFAKEIRLPGALGHSNPTIAIGDLVEFHRNFKLPRGLLCFLMSLAHMNASGSNKRQLEQEDEESQSGEEWSGEGARIDLESQGKEGPWKSATVFGFEADAPNTGASVAADCMKLAHIAADATTYTAWRKAVDEILRKLEPFLADSRRPINDTRVSDMAQLGAAFLKPAIAHCLLLGENCPSEPEQLSMSWRLLRIAVNGPAFVQRAVRIPDLLARRQLLHETLDRVRKKLEWETLIGNEIYRDENGSAFMMPDLADDQKCTLLAEIRGVWDQSAIADEAGFEDRWSDTFALGPKGSYAFRLGELLKIAAPPLHGSRSLLLKSWEGKPGREICAVCGLRPFGSSQKCRERKVCEICETRRDDRSLKWLSDPNRRAQTIWIEEAADRNGRIVLFCGRLRIVPWLDDKGFIEKSYFLDPDRDRHVAPSFARLQRVWTTATDFWGQTLAAAKTAGGEQPGRLSVTGMFRPLNGREIVRSHTYYLGRHDRRISVVCKRADNDSRCTFSLAENPERACQLFELKVEGDDRLRFLLGLQRLMAGEWKVEEPTGYGSPNKNLGILGPIEGRGGLGEIEEKAWSPIIEIMRDPAMLMFLAPAASGMHTVEETLRLYQDQMGKVRDRLGLDVGLVYAPSDTPLPALVQAGRAMLDRPHRRRAWNIAKARKQGDKIRVAFDPGPVWDLTMDKWRGYVETDANQWIAFSGLDNQPQGRKVQVCESTFDFEFLETSGRRFDVAYDPVLVKRRTPEKSHRPWLLEETADLKRCWDVLLGGLGKAQIKALDGILNAKAEAWRPSSVPAYFVRAVLRASNWAAGTPTEGDLEFLVRAAETGMLADAIELFLSVAKSAPDDAMAEPEDETVPVLT